MSAPALAAKPLVWEDRANAVLAYAFRAQAGRPPMAPGVYAFWRDDACLYVGQSRYLARRLAGHERKREFPGCEVRWAICANHHEVERWLIADLAPIGNGHTQAAREIAERRELERQQEESEHRERWPDDVMASVEKHLQSARLLLFSPLAWPASPTDAELQARAIACRRLSVDCLTHAAELERYLQERQAPRR